MSDLYLLHFNNYYNRQVKKFDTVEEYNQYLIHPVVQNVNFIPNDYVNTTQVINDITDDKVPDYLLVVDENIIVSRWYVVETVKNSYNQMTLTLHRDVVADYLNAIKEADCFIEKATVSDSNDLIFNSENMTFNQIKQKEILIKDKSECPWICIYAASRQADGTSTTFGLNIPADDLAIVQTFTNEDELKNSDIYTQGATGIYGEGHLGSVQTTAQYYAGPANIRQYNYYSYKNSLQDTRVATSGVSSSHIMEFPDELATIDYSDAWDDIEYQLRIGGNFPGYNEDLYNQARDWNNKIVKVGEGAEVRYYRVISNLTDSEDPITYRPAAPFSGALADIMYRELSEQTTVELTDYKNGSFQGDALAFVFDRNKYTVQFIDITSSISAIKVDILADRQHLIDAPYDLFCMPYSIDDSIAVSINGIPMERNLSLTIARELIAKYAGSGNIYDAQILPYCPLTTSDVTKNGSNINITLDNDKEVTAIYNDTTVVGYICHSTYSSFSRDIQLDEPIVISNYKIENETDLYRLCSPNYNGIFEFSAAKNGGISIIHIQCTYKPYTPYIKLFPAWNRLYGKNFAPNDYDARGLICGGDFSLPMTTSAWATYEQQNKNYQLSFARQIENLEVNYKYQRYSQQASALAGTLSAGVGGAIAGSAFGPVGMAIGGFGGALLSGLGGAADLEISQKLHNEALDYTQDQFGYQLGNIRAMPQSLSKVTAYNVDNKYFPFIEYYTCTVEEKEALAKKIANNGMTIMVIDKLSKYMNPSWSYTYRGTGMQTITTRGYIKGQIIKLNGFNDDYHLAREIANEIYKGVFLK